MAAGAASVAALCASADTALGSTPEGLAPACRSPDRRGRSQARRRGALGSSAGPWLRRGTAAGDLLSMS